MMNTNIKWLGIAAMAWTTSSFAQTFEGGGMIQNVDMEKMIIQVADQRYLLPRSTLLEGAPALQQVKAGQTANFSGLEASPHPIIESIYIYPDMPQGRNGDPR